jgi:trehalose 6-phosphate synthase
MRAMRRYLRTHDVDNWARSFLSALGAPESATALDSESTSNGGREQHG